MIKLILLDLDDTIYPEIQYVKSGFQTVADCFQDVIGVSQAIIFHELWSLFLDDHSFVFNRFIDKMALPDYLVKMMVTNYREHKPILKSFEGFDEFLKKVQGEYNMGLITDGRPISQHNKIDALGIRHVFDKIIVTDEIGIEYRKPHPRALEQMLLHFKITPDEAIYVGDNLKKDFFSPNKMGMSTIQYVNKDGLYNYDIMPIEYLAQFTVSNWRDILPIIRKL